jgi:hypothetical protein
MLAGKLKMGQIAELIEAKTFSNEMEETKTKCNFLIETKFDGERI